MCCLPRPVAACDDAGTKGGALPAEDGMRVENANAKPQTKSSGHHCSGIIARTGAGKVAAHRVSMRHQDTFLSVWLFFIAELHLAGGALQHNGLAFGNAWRARTRCPSTAGNNVLRDSARAPAKSVALIIRCNASYRADRHSIGCQRRDI